MLSSEEAAEAASMKQAIVMERQTNNFIDDDVQSEHDSSSGAVNYNIYRVMLQFHAHQIITAEQHTQTLAINVYTCQVLTGIGRTYDAGGSPLASLSHLDDNQRRFRQHFFLQLY